MSATPITLAVQQLAEALATEIVQHIAERVRESAPPEKLAYSVREASKALGISQSEVRRLIGAGELRARKAGAQGTKWVVPRTELERYVGGRGDA